MSYLNKEQLQPGEQKKVDDIALQEVENYIEKVEGSTEKTVSDNNSQARSVQSQNNPLQTFSDNKTTGSQQQKKIVLPVDEANMAIGLKQSPSTGVKWLAEWCLMMIKKYPSRVFYSPTNTYD